MGNKVAKGWIFFLGVVLMLTLAPAALAREFTDDGQKYCWHEVRPGDIITSGADMVTHLETCEICKEIDEYNALDDDFDDDDGDEESGICIELESGGYCDSEGKVQQDITLIRFKKSVYVKEDAHFESRNASGIAEKLYPYADGRKADSWYVTDIYDEEGYEYVRYLKGYAGGGIDLVAPEANDVVAFYDLEQDLVIPGETDDGTISYAVTDTEDSETASAAAPTAAPTVAPTSAPTSVPRTGDGANPGLWAVMFILGLIGVAALAGTKSRKRKE